jgi:hypothetical protein
MRLRWFRHVKRVAKILAAGIDTSIPKHLVGTFFQVSRSWFPATVRRNNSDGDGQIQLSVNRAVGQLLDSLC